MEQQFEDPIGQIAASKEEALKIIQQIVSNIQSLQTTTDYTNSLSPDILDRWNKIKERYEKLFGSIQRSASIKIAERLELPDAPSANNQSANATYNNIVTQIRTLSTLLNKQLLPAMGQAKDKVQQAEEWVADYQAKAVDWKNTNQFSWDLGLTNKVAQVKSKYPAGEWISRVDAKYTEPVAISFLEQFHGNITSDTVVEQYMDSIPKEGLSEPLIMSYTLDGLLNLGEGNHRLKAIKQLGYTHAPVRFVKSYGEGMKPNNPHRFDLEYTQNSQHPPGEAKPSWILDPKDTDNYVIRSSSSSREDERFGPSKETTSSQKIHVKKAYPNQNWKAAPKKPDIDKWKKTAIKMESFTRAYGQDYTFPQILFHFTKDWDMFERYGFKNWVRWTKRASNVMKKTAFKRTLFKDRVQQFTQKKKRLRSRINLVQKSLNDLIDSGLIQQQDSNKIYKIISMLGFEAMKIQTPKVAAARVMRSAKLLQKAGFSEGSQLLKEAANEFLYDPVKIVKTAQPNEQEAVDLLRKIKREMDILSYSKHLDALFNIKKDLEKMQRVGDAEAIEKIIRDDLSVLEKLNKKLIEVYTNLSRVPLEISEQEDLFSQESAQEKVQEVPLEVTEATEPEPQRPKQVQPRPRPARPARPTPTIQTEGVPNV